MDFRAPKTLSLDDLERWIELPQTFRVPTWLKDTIRFATNPLDSHQNIPRDTAELAADVRSKMRTVFDRLHGSTKSMKLTTHLLLHLVNAVGDYADEHADYNKLTMLPQSDMKQIVFYARQKASARQSCEVFFKTADVLTLALSNVISRSSSLPPTIQDPALWNIKPAWPPNAILRDAVTSAVTIPGIADTVLGFVSADSVRETHGYEQWMYKTYKDATGGHRNTDDDEAMLAESVDKATRASINADIIATTTNTATDAYVHICRRAYARRAATYLATTKRLYSLWQQTADRIPDDVLATLQFALWTTRESMYAHYVTYQETTATRNSFHTQNNILSGPQQEIM